MTALAALLLNAPPADDRAVGTMPPAQGGDALPGEGEAFGALLAGLEGGEADVLLGGARPETNGTPLNRQAVIAAAAEAGSQGTALPLTIAMEGGADGDGPALPAANGAGAPASIKGRLTAEAAIAAKTQAATPREGGPAQAAIENRSATAALVAAAGRETPKPQGDKNVGAAPVSVDGARPPSAERMAQNAADKPVHRPSLGLQDTGSPKIAPIEAKGPSLSPQADGVRVVAEPSTPAGPVFEAAPPSSRAPAANAAPVQQGHVQAQAQAQAAAAQIADAIKLRTQERSVTVRLDPPELGTVRIEMAFDQKGGVTAILAADQPDTSQLLRRHSEWLQRELGAAGFLEANVSWSESGTQKDDRAPWQRITLAPEAAPGAPGQPSAPSLSLAGSSGGIDIRL